MSTLNKEIIIISFFSFLVCSSEYYPGSEYNPANAVLFFFNFSVTQVTSQPYSIYSISPAFKTAYYKTRNTGTRNDGTRNTRGTTEQRRDTGTRNNGTRNNSGIAGTSRNIRGNKGQNSTETRCRCFLVLEFRCRDFSVLESWCFCPLKKCLGISMSWYMCLYGLVSVFTKSIMPHNSRWHVSC